MLDVTVSKFWIRGRWRLATCAFFKPTSLQRPLSERSAQTGFTQTAWPIAHLKRAISFTSLHFRSRVKGLLIDRFVKYNARPHVLDRLGQVQVGFSCRPTFVWATTDIDSSSMASCHAACSFSGCSRQTANRCISESHFGLRDRF